MQTKFSEDTLIRELGDGLILRRSTPADAEALAAFNAQIHSDEGPEKPDERVGMWARDLLERPHPTFKVGDFTVVEDTRAGKIVSSLNLISQTWSYGGISFGVGRPELVGTLPEYRNRGLVRIQFEVVHQWSAERGELVQAITGIPYYYRLFGYEMALPLSGGRAGYQPGVPKLKEGEQEPFRLRPAVEGDLAFIAQLYQAACQRYLVNCIWDDALWRYELTGKSAKNVNRSELRLIETPQGEPVGFLAHPFMNWNGVSMLAALAYELKKGLSFGEVTPSVIRYLWDTGKANAAKEGKAEEFASFGFWLGNEHPVYQALGEQTLPRVRKPYAWYIRVAELPGFLRHITPVLEQRLAGSPFAGYSGELKITFYRGGLRLKLEKGILAEVESWQPSPQGHSGDAAFPSLTFLQLLFGYRDLEELVYAFPDCWHNEAAYGLLKAFFPKQNSDIWPVS